MKGRGKTYAVRYEVNGNPVTSYVQASSKNDALLLARRRWPHGEKHFIAEVLQ